MLLKFFKDEKIKLSCLLQNLLVLFLTVTVLSTIACIVLLYVLVLQTTVNIYVYILVVTYS